MMFFIRFFTADGWVRKGAPTLPTVGTYGYGVGPYGLTGYGE